MSSTPYEHQDLNYVIIKKKDLKKQTHTSRPDNVVSVTKVYDPENPDAEPMIKPKIIEAEFGKQIIAARVAKGMNQKQLANALSIDAAVIAEYERGTGIKSGRVVSKIKKYLNIHN
jgi:ribosome-binding protein aMBF1 (putative translation factor)